MCYEYKCEDATCVMGISVKMQHGYKCEDATCVMGVSVNMQHVLWV
jgi:hypothetical protein